MNTNLMTEINIALTKLLVRIEADINVIKNEYNPLDDQNAGAMGMVVLLSRLSAHGKQYRAVLEDIINKINEVQKEKP